MTKTNTLDELFENIESTVTDIFNGLRNPSGPGGTKDTPTATESDDDLTPAGLAREAVRLLKASEELAATDPNASAQLASLADRFIRLSETAML